MDWSKLTQMVQLDFKGRSLRCCWGPRLPCEYSSAASTVFNHDPAGYRVTVTFAPLQLWCLYDIHGLLQVDGFIQIMFLGNRRHLHTDWSFTCGHRHLTAARGKTRGFSLGPTAKHLTCHAKVLLSFRESKETTGGRSNAAGCGHRGC